MEEKTGSVSLEDRKFLHLTGITEVMVFGEREAEFASSVGILQITGEGMHMEKLDLDTGNVILTGLFSSLYYPEDAPSERKGLISRLFR